MKFTAQQIAQLVNGTVVGDSNAEVSGFSKIDHSESGTLSFLSNPKYEHYLYEAKSSIILLGEELTLKKPVEITLIVVKNPYKAFATLLDIYQKFTRSYVPEISKLAEIHSSAKLQNEIAVGSFTVISENVKIDSGTRIYPRVFVGKNVTIGKNVTLFPGVVLMDNTVIGDDCILQPNVVIGADGFGFAPTENGQYQKIPQLGNVIIEPCVEIGANTCIDAATLGSTVIKSGTKLDNLIQIAHNCTIGENTVIAAQTGISGSTVIGNQCVIGGQVGMAGHISVANRTKIGAGSGVLGNIKEENQSLMGLPLQKVRDNIKLYAYLRKLKDLFDRVSKLENKSKEN